MEVVLQNSVSGGLQTVFKHHSYVTNCDMKFSIFVPDAKSNDEKFHVLFFLPGVGCNEQDFLNPSEFYEHAVSSRFIVVCPDTSPRVNLPGDKIGKGQWVGQGAGWYIDATEEPFAKHYQMYSYVSTELHDIVLKNFPALPKFGICGHSMGGTGAICIGLRNPEKFPTISLFAANCNPISWGPKTIYTVLLGDNRDRWNIYDASEVVKRYDGPRREILADQGTDDYYHAVKNILNPEKLVDATLQNPRGNAVIAVNLRMQEGLDHSFHFVKQVWKDHFEHHLRNLSIESSQQSQ